MVKRARSSVSIVIPAYNEEAGIHAFHAEHLSPALAALDEVQFEVIYVDDGSTDRTRQLLGEIAAADSRVRVVALSRNFGKEIATTAGITHSHGDATIIMDADGQHPPAQLGLFIEEWLNGAQIVVGVRDSNEKEGAIKRIGSRTFYRVLNGLSEMRTVPRSTDFRLIDREVREAFLSMGERNRITRGLIDWLGFDTVYVHFDAPARIAGTASYSISKLTKLALNSFTTLSLRPLYFFGYLGAIITTLALLAGLFVLVEQYLLGDPLGLNFTGAASLGLLVTFLVGLLLTAQGVTAVYLGHIYAQTQGRPLFVINTAQSTRLDTNLGAQ